jgi:DNA-directed RNA polymerase subunit omega
MARVTVEDCAKVVKNRFELVLLAAQRARDISAGQDATIDIENDKNAVVALKEIADNKVELDDLRSNIVRGVNRHDVEISEDEELVSLQETENATQTTNDNQVDGLAFEEVEQEEAPIDESDVFAAAEDLFSDDAEDEIIA